MASETNQGPLEDVVGFARALKAAMDRRGVNQSGLSRRTRDPKVRQNTISNWLKGQDPPGSPAAVFSVERALELPGGALSAYLGYLPTELHIVGIETAIALDGTLDDRARQALLDTVSRFRPPLGGIGDAPESAAQ